MAVASHFLWDYKRQTGHSFQAGWTKTMQKVVVGPSSGDDSVVADWAVFSICEDPCVSRDQIHN